MRSSRSAVGRGTQGRTAEEATRQPKIDRCNRKPRPKPTAAEAAIATPSPRYSSCCRLNMDSLQGQLLIASPDLPDPNFARTVVLIAVHGEEGALGSDPQPRDEHAPASKSGARSASRPACATENVRHGGPVSGSLMALHDQRPHANLVVTEDVYVATELNAMESLAGSDEGQVLFYVGHSGWGPGQLENELAEGSWLVLPASRRTRLRRPRHHRPLEAHHDRSRPPPGPVRGSDQARSRQSRLN